MKNDLDFDELHEAVNKLMVQAQKPKGKRPSAKSMAKAVSRPSVKVAERPADKDKPADKPERSDESKDEAIKVTVRKPAATVMPKRRGMAMDVVQAPKPSVVAPPSARAARTAPTLQPTGPVAPEPPRPREASATAPAPAPEPAPQNDVDDDVLASLNMQTDSTAKPSILDDDHKQATASAFPDPLDVHGFSGDDSPKTVEPKEQPTALQHDTPAINPIAPEPETEENPLLKEDDDPAPAVPQPEPVEAPSVTPAPEPPATPFVNAKVEKRPLGAYAEAAPAPSPAPMLKPQEDTAKPTSAPEKTEPAAVQVPAAPAELRPEVVAVESAETDYAPEAPQTSEEPLNNLRQMSIPQQYHTDEKEPAKDERPIFDTKNYHPPLQPVATAKHHSGSKAGAILTFILIILLVAAGVGAYFIATGSLDITKLF